MSSSSLMPVSDSTSTSRPRVGGAVVRKARLQDAVNIFDLVNSLSGDGTLLRRNYAEICENVRDFAIAESESGVFLGCGALHLYGPHLAEVRSIVVKPEAKGQGAGGKPDFAQGGAPDGAKAADGVAAVKAALAA